MSAPPTLTVLSLGEDTARFEGRFLSVRMPSSRYTFRYGIR